MITIGLTGGIGSGKSSVARWFMDKGVKVLDADKIAHEILNQDRKIIEKIQTRFGSEVITELGQVNRKKLGEIVFKDIKARESLEGIIHPEIISNLRNEGLELEKEGISLVIWDVPLLFETGLDKEVDEIWVVWVNPDTQIERIKQRDHLHLEEIGARINAQKSLNDKVKGTDICIDNSGSWIETEWQLEKQWERIKGYIQG